jgi:hypothetical protein
MHESLRQRIKPYVKAVNDDTLFEGLCIQQAEALVNAYYKTTEQVVVPFICSFCSHEDDEEAKVDGLLSQWRGYGPDGGFAVEFETSAIEQLMGRDSDSHNGYYMTDVIYGETSRDFDVLKEDITTVTDVAFRMLLSNMGLEEEEPDIEHSYFPFMRCATRLKHSGFREEQEIRIVHIRGVDPSVSDGRRPFKPFDFRSHRGSCVPYVRLFSHAELKLPIKRIVVGPHPRSDLRHKSLELFIKQAGIDAEVQVSAIPYLPE